MDKYGLWSRIGHAVKEEGLTLLEYKQSVQDMRIVAISEPGKDLGNASRQRK